MRFLVRLLFLSCGLIAAATAAEPKYILFLTADGFRTDYLEWYNPPHLKQLIREGVRVSHSTNVFPSLTTPNMTSLVTGAWPRTTGIAANSQYRKETDKIEKGPRGNAAETIAETLSRAGWKTAAVNHFMLQNRGADKYVSTPYENTEKAADAIVALLKNEKPQLLAAIFGATDHAGHQFGPQSEAVKAAVLGIDRAVGRIVTTLKELGIYEETVIAFTSDHGMSAFEPKAVSTPAASALRKAGFRVATNEAELSSDTQIVVLDAGVRTVYFRQATPAERATARAALGTIVGAEVLDRARLDELGCHDNRSGDLIVSPLPGYTMSGAGKKGGLHGRFTEQNPILVLRGPGIKTGATIDAARNIDVMPTLLRLVHVPPPPTVDGRVITDALR